MSIHFIFFFFLFPDYHFLRLDGMTAIKQRMALVDTFNNDPSISKVFLSFLFIFFYYSFSLFFFRCCFIVFLYFCFYCLFIFLYFLYFFFLINFYYFIFILTTKVGGLGINLVGADRVLLFDPDWVREERRGEERRGGREGRG